MIQLAANLSLMFTEVPFLDRFDAAADAGFRAVEFMFPYELPAEDIAAKLAERGLSVVLFNLPAGDWAAGERGIGALPDRVDEFRSGVQSALEYARVLRCPRLHLMAGKAPHDELHRRTLLSNIAYAAPLAAAQGIDILLEPINTRVDIPGYFYDSTASAMSVLNEAAQANVKLQYDIYHMQIMEGDLTRRIEQLLPWIGHMQLADNPGRGEPGSGEIHFDWLLRRIDELGYSGWIGCEYKPKAGTTAGLGWARPYLGASRE